LLLQDFLKKRDQFVAINAIPKMTSFGPAKKPAVLPCGETQHLGSDLRRGILEVNVTNILSG
jgi:hypothetical protein